MKKVGIVTVHRAYNYGAVLQAYALTKVINDFSYQSEIIDYNTKLHERIYSREGKGWLERTKRPLFDKLRCERFEKFISNLPLSEKQYFEAKDFNNIPKYDIYVAGSDQIWNVKMKEIMTEVHFLWHKEFKNKIAYAPSLGSSTFKDISKYKKYIEKFDYIFMREKSGAAIIERLINKEPIQDVLDPTLLLTADEWKKVTNKKYKGKKPYLLCYSIGYEIMAIVRELGKRLDLEIKIIAYDNYYIGNNMVNYPSTGPIEFLDLVRDASLVCTNSYHGLLFSILFGRPMYLIENDDNMGDSRKRDILHKFGLDSRIMNKKILESFQLDKPIDFDYVNITLDKERKKSLKLLKDALDSI